MLRRGKLAGLVAVSERRVGRQRPKRRLTAEKAVCSLWHTARLLLSPVIFSPSERPAGLLGILAGLAGGWLQAVWHCPVGCQRFTVCLEQSGSGNTAVHPCEMPDSPFLGRMPVLQGII